MPKYKLRNFYKTLLQIWLFYYFLNALKVYECQEFNDVEFINSRKPEKDDVSDFLKDGKSDSEFMYEPIDQSNDFPPFNEIDDTKNVDLNVNNDLPHENETPDDDAGEVPSRFTEISEREITGEKILYLSESPFLLRQDLDVRLNAKLIVEPGVTIYFAPMVGITVYGQIQAIVSKHFYSIHKVNSSHALVSHILSLLITKKKLFALRQV